MPIKFFRSIWFALILSLLIAIILFSSLSRLIGGPDSVYISASVSILIFLLTNKTTVDREEQKLKKCEEEKIYEELNKKPDFKYVDEKDANTVNMLRQHMDESKISDKKQMDLVRSMDNKLDILINKIR
jgi:hypothetical protein